MKKVKVKGLEEYYEVTDAGQVWSVRANRFLSPRNCVGYYRFCLMVNKVKRDVLAHRLVAEHFLPGWADGLQVDHINGNRRDNRVCNLRMVTKLENQRAARINYGTSQYRGVTWHPKNKRWQAGISINGRWKYVGQFGSELAAALARDNKAKELGFLEEGLNFKFA